MVIFEIKSVFNILVVVFIFCVSTELLARQNQKTKQFEIVINEISNGPKSILKIKKQLEDIAFGNIDNTALLESTLFLFNRFQNSDWAKYYFNLSKINLTTEISKTLYSFGDYEISSYLAEKIGDDDFSRLDLKSRIVLAEIKNKKENIPMKTSLVFLAGSTDNHKLVINIFGSFDGKRQNATLTMFDKANIDKLVLPYSTITLNDIKFSSYDEDLKYYGLCKSKLAGTSFLLSSTNEKGQNIYLLLEIVDQNIIQNEYVLKKGSSCDFRNINKFKIGLLCNCN